MAQYCVPYFKVVRYGTVGMSVQWHSGLISEGNGIGFYFNMGCGSTSYAILQRCKVWYSMKGRVALWLLEGNGISYKV